MMGGRLTLIALLRLASLPQLGGTVRRGSENIRVGLALRQGGGSGCRAEGEAGERRSAVRLRELRVELVLEVEGPELEGAGLAGTGFALVCSHPARLAIGVDGEGYLLYADGLDLLLVSP